MVFIEDSINGEKSADSGEGERLLHVSSDKEVSLLQG